VSDYVLTLITFALLFGSLAVAYNLSVGLVGLLSISHAAFFSIGAYAYGVLGESMGGDGFLPACGLGMLIAAVIAVTLGVLLIVLPEQYVILGTFALQVTFTTLLTNWIDVTNGVQGMAGIPPIRLLGWEAQSGLAKLGLTVVFAAGTLVLSWLVLASRLGFIARAARDEPAAAAAIGIAVRRTRVGFFVLGACLASVAGAIYAGVIGYIDPSSFTVEVSIQFLSMVVVGGLGSPLGAFVGGIMISLLPPVLQEFSLELNAAAAIQQVVFGALMVAMIVFRPGGLLPERRLVRNRAAGGVAQ